MGANVRAPQVRFEDISNNNVFTASARIKNVRDAESQQAPQVQYISGTRGSRRVNTDANIETKELLNNALSEFKSLRDELLERVLAEVDRHIANNAEYTDKRLETYTDTRLEMLRKDILKEINMHNAGAHDVRAPHDAYAPDNARAPDRLPDADLKHDTELNNSFNTLNNSFNTDTLRLDIHRKAHGAAAHMPAARVPDVRVFNDVRPAALRKPGHLKSKPQDSRNIMRKLYEEAVYTMYQNNYPEAAKLFKAITDYYPDNKAARIRLQECMEASGNA
jgi:transcription termination factor NusB